MLEVLLRVSIDVVPYYISRDVCYEKYHIGFVVVDGGGGQQDFFSLRKMSTTTSLHVFFSKWPMWYLLASSSIMLY